MYFQTQKVCIYHKWYSFCKQKFHKITVGCLVTRINIRFIELPPSTDCRITSIPVGIQVRITPTYPVVWGDWMGQFFEWDAKYNVLCQGRFGTIKVPPFSKPFCSHLQAMVTSPYEWKIPETAVKQPNILQPSGLLWLNLFREQSTLSITRTVTL
jgi:hypothetical protein